MKMLTLVPLCFLFAWMLPADSMAVLFRIPRPRTIETIQLSMVDNSTDDMYFGCQPQMMKKVHSHYLKKEKKDEVFKTVWNNAAQCAKKKLENEDKALTTDHKQAICVYTSNNIYKTFNPAVRTQGPVYNTAFKFHSLHFLLTSAIQILNSNYHCHTTYRRTDDKYVGDVNQRVRFGSFASSSFRTDLKFGNQTCFQIKTCLGAYVGDYSVLGYEKEVLIPPYETFNITKIVIGPGSHEKLKDCKVVYELESDGAVSRLNCKAVFPKTTSASSSSLEEAREQTELPSPRFLSVITLD